MSTPETVLDESSPADAVVGDAQPKPKLNLQVQVVEKGTCQRHVTVTVAREDIDRYYREAFDELVPKAEVAGFRAGRAPRKLVESRFKEQLANQVKGSLLMDSVTQITEDQKFTAISEPDFDFGAILLPEAGPMTFEFNVEVRPEFAVPEWKGLSLVRPVHEYSDAEIQTHLVRLLEKHGRHVPKEGSVADGDVVGADFEFVLDGAIVNSIPDLQVVVRKNLSFHDGELSGLDDLLRGAVLGDTRETPVKVSLTAAQAELRGKEVVARVTVRSISTIALPDLTAGFLQRIGGFEDEADLRGAICEELNRQLAYYQQRRIREQITAKLTAAANWDLPPELLKRQFRRELDRAVLELQAAGFSDDMINSHSNTIRQNSLEATARLLKEHFIFERIAEEEKLEAEEHDYDKEIKKIAEQSQQSTRRVRARLDKTGKMDALRNQIVEGKVIELIRRHATFTEEPFTPAPHDSTAVEYAISGHVETEAIPEAKYGNEPEQRKTPD